MRRSEDREGWWCKKIPNIHKMPDNRFSSNGFVIAIAMTEAEGEFICHNY